MSPTPMATRLVISLPTPFCPQASCRRAFVNGAAVGEGRISKITYSPYESLDIGSDLGSPVGDDYQSPFAFAGSIEKVHVELQ